MALQIMPGKLSNNLSDGKKEILYDKYSPQINITDTLKPICVDFFKEEIFSEDGEDITVSIVPFKGIKPLFDRLQIEAKKIISEHFVIRQSQIVYFLSLNEDIISFLSERHAFAVTPEKSHQTFHMFLNNKKKRMNVFQQNRKILNKRINYQSPYNTEIFIWQNGEQRKAKLNFGTLNTLYAPSTLHNQEALLFLTNKFGKRILASITDYIKREELKLINSVLNEFPDVRNALTDIVLFQSLIISMLLNSEAQNYVLTIV